MKKITGGMLLLASIFAQCAVADNTQEILASGQQVILSDCSLLADDVTVSLSNRVQAGYFCRTGAGVVSNITIATCHTAGRTATRTVETPCVDTSGGVALQPGEVACDGTGSGVNVASNQGAAIFVGRTGGGAIGPQPLNGSNCADDGSSLNQYLN
ncbi:hypothetical protein [Pseudomonas zhanjiangensis]|uniref:Uncharacterized protein n=1 Tax=Pseudomonas zhanjiangensis TaxID=3239015 RepID=A0ABV3YSY9_9PSED